MLTDLERLCHMLSPFHVAGISSWRTLGGEGIVDEYLKYMHSCSYARLFISKGK